MKAPRVELVLKVPVVLLLFLFTHSTSYGLTPGETIAKLDREVRAHYRNTGKFLPENFERYYSDSVVDIIEGEIITGFHNLKERMIAVEELYQLIAESGLKVDIRWDFHQLFEVELKPGLAVVYGVQTTFQTLGDEVERLETSHTYLLEKNELNRWIITYQQSQRDVPQTEEDIKGRDLLKKIQRNRNERNVVTNLRTIAIAGMQYILSEGDPSVSYKQLLDAGYFDNPPVPFAGEDYSQLIVKEQGGTLKVVLANGQEISYPY